MSTTSTSVRLQRVIPAPPELVYRAWLDPATLRRWMSPKSFEASVDAQVDERVGGHYRIFHSRDGVERGGFESEVLELVPGTRLVFLWRFVGPERVSDPSHDSLLTVTFAPSEGGTELTLVHERLEAFAAAMPEVAGMIETGWSQALDKLEAALAR